MTGIDNPDAAGVLPTLTGTWRLDPAATTVQLHTKAMWGMAKVKGTVAATEGSAVVGADGTVTGTLVLDAATIDTAQAKRDKHLRGPDFFDIEQYPSFVYTVASAQVEPDGAVSIAATFTAHGQTHPLPTRGTLQRSGSDAVTLTLSADLDRREWGMGWAKMGAGVQIHIEASATFTRS